VNELITVYSAEVMRRLRSRTFMLGLFFGILGIAAMMELPRFFSQYDVQSSRILIAGDPRLVSAARALLAKDFEIRGERTSTAAPSLDELKRKKASSLVAILPTGNGVRAILYSKDPSSSWVRILRRDLAPLNLQLAARIPPRRVQSLLAVPVQTRTLASKFGSAAQADTAKIVAYILLLLLYILIMVNSQLIMSSVAEEKTSRIAELLVASVNPGSLLAGKVLASATLAIAQMVIWVGIAYLLGAQPSPAGAVHDMDNSASFSLNGISSTDVAGFVLFFLVGFLQTATLFAAVGSLINRTEDLGSIGGPLFLPVVAAFIIAISALAVPDSPAVVVASFVPLVAPFVMFARIVVSSVPVWQIATSLAINVAAIALIAVIGGRIYRVGMLLYGRTPKPSQIWHAIRS
jgi:ABC-2 type transport system permease protein